MYKAERPERAGVASAAMRFARERVSRRLSAHLEDRDPDYIREVLPLLWLIATFYFRAEVQTSATFPPIAPHCLSATTPAAT